MGRGSILPGFSPEPKISPVVDNLKGIGDTRAHAHVHTRARTHTHNLYCFR